MAPTIKIKNCLQPTGKLPRYDAGVGDSVLFRDDKNRLEKGVIHAITQNGVSVSLASTSNEEVISILTTSIVALDLSE